MRKRNTLAQLAFSFAASDSFLFVCLRASASVFQQEIHFESNLAGCYLWWCGTLMHPKIALPPVSPYLKCHYMLAMSVQHL